MVNNKDDVPLDQPQPLLSSLQLNAIVPTPHPLCTATYAQYYMSKLLDPFRNNYVVVLHQLDPQANIAPIVLIGLTRLRRTMSIHATLSLVIHDFNGWMGNPVG